MPRAGWWRCSDGSVVNLDGLAVVRKQGDTLVKTGETIKAPKPQIVFEFAVSRDAWIDEFETVEVRDRAYETLTSCLPAAGVKYGTTN